MDIADTPLCSFQWLIIALRDQLVNATISKVVVEGASISEGVSGRLTIDFVL